MSFIERSQNQQWHEACQREFMKKVGKILKEYGDNGDDREAFGSILNSYYDLIINLLII